MFSASKRTGPASASLDKSESLHDDATDKIAELKASKSKKAKVAAASAVVAEEEEASVPAPAVAAAAAAPLASADEEKKEKKASAPEQKPKNLRKYFKHLVAATHDTDHRKYTVSGDALNLLNDVTAHVGTVVADAINTLHDEGLVKKFDEETVYAVLGNVLYPKYAQTLRECAEVSVALVEQAEQQQQQQQQQEA